MNYVINVDWLQICCHDRNLDRLDALYNCRDGYEFKLLEHSSRHFKELWEVYNPDGDKYAVIQRRPFSSILSKDLCIVQLCNRELYRPMMAINFAKFLATHQFYYKSISRLDVCLDSNDLYKGLKHSNLIKGIMTGKYLKNNQARVKWHFNSIANVGKPMECNSCSFGSLSSAVSTKMYNKTQELKEVVNKPYIEESWAYNGLDLNRDIWRVEISIKADATTAVHTSTGEIFKLSLSQLAFDSQIVDIFFTYAQKYFSFKLNTGEKNKSRMPDVNLFPPERKTAIRPIKITEAQDASRSDRIFLKKLHSLLDDLRNMDNVSEKAVWEVSNTFVMAKSMEKWREEKIITNDRGDKKRFNEKLNLERRIFYLSKDIQALYPLLFPSLRPLLDEISKSLKPHKHETSDF